MLLLAACGDDGLGPSDGSGNGGPGVSPAALFASYVALGNSITAGFQSGGINDSTQRQAYPALLAARAGASFQIPSLGLPGCPPPLVGPLSSERVGGGSASTCSATARPTGAQNLAIPGATLRDALEQRSTAGSTSYAWLILGGRTQVEALIEARPTLVSVWLGNNDALAAALAGRPALLTREAAFAADLARLVAGVRQSTAREVILIGVVDPLLAPILQPGVFFFLAGTLGLLPKPVSQECAPGAAASQNLVSALGLFDIAEPEVRCAAEASYVLAPAEQDSISARVQAFNRMLLEAAQAHGWIFVDADAITHSFLDDPNKLRKCQDLAAAQTLTALQTAAVATCPGPFAPNFFGSLVSLDGFHPSAEAHRVFGDTLAARLRRKHRLNL